MAHLSFSIVVNVEKGREQGNPITIQPILTIQFDKALPDGSEFCSMCMCQLNVLLGCLNHENLPEANFEFDMKV